MAKIYGEIASSALMTFDKSFSRSNGQPLDSTEIYYSLAAAEAYAATDVAYAGQKIVVIETEDEVTTITHYSIEADNSLKELGAIPVGDGVTVEVVDGKIQLAGLEGKESGTYQPFLVDGEIEWRVPSETTVEGLDARLKTAEEGLESVEGVVGDAESGLVKAVADNKAAIEAEVEAARTAEKANADAIAAVEGVIGEVAEGKTVVGLIEEATYDDTELAGKVKAIEDDYLKGQDKTDLEDSISAINTKIGEVPEGENIVDMIADATYDDTELAGRVKAIEDDYLVGQDKTDLEEAIEAAEESAVNRILGYLAEEEINESYDTLKEVAAWIESDTTNSSALIKRVSDIEADYLKGADKEELDGAIEDLVAFVGMLPEGAASETVVAYIQEVVDGLQIGDYAKAADLVTLAGRVTTIENKLKDIEEGAQVNAIDAIDEAQFAIGEGKKLTLLDIAMGKVTGLEDALAGKVDVVEGSRLMTEAEGTKLEGIQAGAEVNYIKGVDGDQFGVEEGNLTLLDVAMSKVTGLEEALAGKAAKGTTLAEYGITDAYTKTETEARIQEVLDGLSDTSETAASVAQALETYKTSNDQRVGTIEDKLSGIAAGAQVNVLEAVKVGGTLLSIVDKTVDIPVASVDALGVVKSAADVNKIKVAEDGTMEVNTINVDKLAQTEGTELVLDGGSAI